MGDFDKVQAPESTGDQKRKQMLVGVLGAVLLGVVGFHFLKGSPERVHASMIPGADPMTAAAESPAQAIAAIESDPTASLLKGTAALQPELSDVPHDPFKMSDRWLGSLKVKTPDKVVIPVVEHHAPTQPKAELPTISSTSLKIEGITRMGGKNVAFINGSIVMPGQTMGDALIVEIQEDRVVVRHKDYQEGKTTTLPIQPKIK